MCRQVAGAFVLVGAGAVAGAIIGGAVWAGSRGGEETGAVKPAFVPVSLPSQPSAEQQLAARRQRGAYLWAVGGCNDCHTPKDERGKAIPGMMMAGHPEKAPLPRWDPAMLKDNILMTMAPTTTAFAGPWGVSVAPNLTPDKETGIGEMTAEQLIKSWKSGNHWKEPRPILPPMPAPGYSAMTDDDIRAVHAFLMTLPAVRNASPKSVVAPAPEKPAK